MQHPPAPRPRSNEHHSTAAVAVSKVAKSLASPAVLSVPARCIVCFAPASLADVLFCLPALSAVRESFPGAQLLCVARAGLAPIVRASQIVDEVLERPRGGLSAQASLLLKLHACKPDIAITFSPARNAVLMAWSSGAAIRAGFEEAKMEALLTHRVKRNGPPRIEAFLELTRSLGCKTPHLDYCGLLDTGPEATRLAQLLLDNHGIGGRFVLAAPASPDGRARGSGPTWSGDKWARTLLALSESWPVALVGSAPKRGRPGLALPDWGRIVDLRGRADLLTVAALCARSSLLVGAEGGLLHLASAMKTPVVGLYRADDEGKTLPRGPRRIAHATPELAPEQVLALARDLIGL